MSLVTARLTQTKTLTNIITFTVKGGHMSFKHEMGRLSAKSAVMAGIGVAALVGINHELGNIHLPHIGLPSFGNPTPPDLEGKYAATISKVWVPDDTPVLRAYATGQSNLHIPYSLGVWGIGAVVDAVANGTHLGGKDANVVRTDTVDLEVPRNAIAAIKPYALPGTKTTNKNHYGIELDVNTDLIQTHRMDPQTPLDSHGVKEAHSGDALLNRFQDVFTDGSDGANRGVTFADYTDGQMAQTCAESIVSYIQGGIESAFTDEMQITAQAAARVGDQKTAASVDDLSRLPIRVVLEHAGWPVEPNVVTLPPPPNMTTTAMLAKQLGEDPKNVHINTSSGCTPKRAAEWQMTTLIEAYNNQAAGVTTAGAGQSHVANANVAVGNQG
jgi:hypothetical protein